jgi:hypothetical protein
VASAPPFIALCTNIGSKPETPIEGCGETEAPNVSPIDAVLAPRQSTVFKYNATPVPGAGFRVGKQLLLFKVRAQSETQNPPRPGAVFATREVDVTVFGESIILTVLSVASFFLLPGFLILVTIRLLWGYVSPRTEVLKATDANFWFLAIGLSILWLLVYPQVTDVFGNRRDLIRGYTSVDIVIVWFASVCVGVVLYLVLRLILKWAKRGKRESGGSDGSAGVGTDARAKHGS